MVFTMVSDFFGIDESFGGSQWAFQHLQLTSMVSIFGFMVGRKFYGWIYDGFLFVERFGVESLSVTGM